MKNIWIIGCGDIGRRVVQHITHQYQTTNYTINAVVSSKTSAALCQSLNINTIVCDLDAPKTFDHNQFKDAEIYYFAPPPKTGLSDTRIQAFLAQLVSSPRKFVLISTTGVYGDCQGEWIDETRTVNPQTERANRRVSAETTLINWSERHQTPYVILRVPGIYALDRLPLARLEKKLPVVQASEAAFTNRIHADDLATICVSAMDSPVNNETFNASDGDPGTMVDYFNRIADYAGLARPRQISLEQAKHSLSPGMLSYAGESRRIGNAKLLNILGVQLKYPSLASALK